MQPIQRSANSNTRMLCALALSLFLCACHSTKESRVQQALREGWDVAALQAAMRDGVFTAVELSGAYVARIRQFNPQLNAILEINPDAISIAQALDGERAAGIERSALHGIPIVLKDNIDTADQMHTSAGSLALLDAPTPERDAFLVTQLREAGAVILGKTNLSEWANFRSTSSSSGWSARGGQTQNPYVATLTPCGSSAGSAVAIAAALAPLAIGTETSGSIVCPSAHNSVVGLKPSLGLISRSGIIPIAHSQDTAGPMARSVADLALLLNALVGKDPSDDITTNRQTRTPLDYTQALDLNALKGKRIGVMRQFFELDPDLDALLDRQLEILKNAGAVLIDVEIRPPAAFHIAQLELLLYEFKNDINNYLYERKGTLQSLTELIEFNRQNADTEMASFGQELFEQANAKGDLGQAEYLSALGLSKAYSQSSIDSLVEELKLDAFVAPTNSSGWAINPEGDQYGNYVSSASLAAAAGYPNITVPAGYIGKNPIGISFSGTLFSEATLIGIAFAFEQLSLARVAPELQ
jgi:amidase